MKILYDHQTFSLQNYGGISRYFYELINFFDENSLVNVSGYYSNNYYLNKTAYKKNEFLRKIPFRGKTRILNFINKIDSISKIKKEEYDILHPTYYNPYFLRYINRKPFVITVHDMIHEKFPNLFSKNDITKIWKKQLLNKATKIIAISENTKKDILDFYDIDETKIDVIYHGNSISLNNKEDISIKLPEKYFLFIGSRIGYKNFTLFVEAVAPIINKEKDIYIFCVGGGKFSEKELFSFKNKNILNNVMQQDLDDKELIIAYKKAIAFIYPSLYEGFGMPILESYACKCPLICSNTSCFPEIAKEGASFFNPNDPENIREAIETVLYNEDYRNKLTEKGLIIERDFCWEKTCKKTEELYKEIL